MRCLDQSDGAPVHPRKVRAVSEADRLASVEVEVHELKARLAHLESHTLIPEAAWGTLSSPARDRERLRPMPTATQRSAWDSGLGPPESEVSDMIAPPMHLRALFDNGHIATRQDTSPGKPPEFQIQQDGARKALQTLLPSENHLLYLLSSPCSWLRLLHELLPGSPTPLSGEDVWASYGEMRGPAINPMRLATWLITVAIMAQQPPTEGLASFPSSDLCLQRRLRFVAEVSEAVELQLFNHDKMMGSVEGVHMGIHLIRL